MILKCTPFVQSLTSCPWATKGRIETTSGEDTWCWYTGSILKIRIHEELDHLGGSVAKAMVVGAISAPSILWPRMISVGVAENGVVGIIRYNCTMCIPGPSKVTPVYEGAGISELFSTILHP